MLDLSEAFDTAKNDMHLHNLKEIGLHTAQWVPKRDEKLFRKYRI